MVLRMVFMWWLMSWFKGAKNPQQGAKLDPVSYSFPKFNKGELVDCYVFLTETASVRGGHYDLADLIWSETSVALAAQDPRNISYMYEPSKNVQNNGSLYLHAVLAKAGETINPADPDYNEDLVFGRAFNLITYFARPRNETGVKLLSGETFAEGVKKVRPDAGPREIISFLKPNISIQVVDHFVTYPKKGIPQPIAPHLQYGMDANYFPIIYFNDFWLLRDYLVPMNETVTNVTLHLDLGYISTSWWTLLLQMDQSFSMQRGMGMQAEGEADELKRIFLEGNPILLAVTMVVSLLHTVFDMLAFKNDIGFWKNNKSMEGLSARSVIINAVCQLIILLYLFDNETSYVVLFSSVVGTGIEFWKVTKAMNVTFDPAKFPYVKFSDRASYTKTKTKQYDEEATRYLSYVLYPCIVGYAIYALLYKSHKSWYSWVLSSLVGAVYLFGFILMCPQLYLNYKLKSVAHLPWRQMTYKFLNTIIDDLFAFVIKMPLLHRLSVFRDDLVFLVYLYQRWIYRVDPKRVNEFGWGGEPEAEQVDTAKTEDAAPLLPATDGSALVQQMEDKAQGSGEETCRQRLNASTTVEAVEAVASELEESRKDK
ncbi:transmembrane protein [Haematococcus lacustris]